MANQLVGRANMALIAALQQDPECNCIVLEKNLGQTQVVGQRMLDQPAWH